MNIIFAIICYLIVPMSGLCIDLYAPSLPAISASFATTDIIAKYSISFYLLSFGLFQLFAGPITDHFGRKKPIVISLIIFIVISYLMIFSTSITIFIIYRILQGACISFASVASRAIIPDVYKKNAHQYKKMMNYMTIVWALGPIVAPFIGGHLQQHWGWHSCFYFFSIYGIFVLLVVIFFYHETADKQKELSFKRVFSNYFTMLRDNHFLIGTLCLGLLYSLLVIFSTIGVFLVENVLHYSSVTFGNIALLMGLAWFLGNIANRFSLHLSDKFNRIKLSVAMLIPVLSCLGLISICFFYPRSLLALAIFMFIIFFFAGIVFPNFFALCVSLFSHIAGSASALMGSFFILLTSVFVFVFGLVHIHSIMLLTSIILLLSIACLVLVSIFFSLQRSN